MLIVMFILAALVLLLMFAVAEENSDVAGFFGYIHFFIVMAMVFVVLFETDAVVIGTKMAWYIGICVVITLIAIAGALFTDAIGRQNFASGVLYAVFGVGLLAAYGVEDDNRGRFGEGKNLQIVSELYGACLAKAEGDNVNDKLTAINTKIIALHSLAQKGYVDFEHMNREAAMSVAIRDNNHTKEQCAEVLNGDKSVSLDNLGVPTKEALDDARSLMREEYNENVFNDDVINSMRGELPFAKSETSKKEQPVEIKTTKGLDVVLTYKDRAYRVTMNGGTAEDDCSIVEDKNALLKVCTTTNGRVRVHFTDNKDEYSTTSTYEVGQFLDGPVNLDKIIQK